jgi:adenylate cyclase
VAVLEADVASYSRLMAADETQHATSDRVVDPAIATHNGRMVKTTGHGMLVEFCKRCAQ